MSAPLNEGPQPGAPDEAADQTLPGAEPAPVAQTEGPQEPSADTEAGNEPAASDAGVVGVDLDSVAGAGPKPREDNAP